MPHDLDEKAVEAAARRSYEYEGDRKGCSYIGWERESDEVREEWRQSVRVPILAYESAKPASEPSAEMVEALTAAQEANAKILVCGGLDIEEWWDKLVAAQQKVAAVLRAALAHSPPPKPTIGSRLVVDGVEAVVVRKDALDWLNGEHPDEFENTNNIRGNFWWRIEFRRRAMLSPEALGGR